MPVRHQIRRSKGFRYPPGAKSVHRGTGFGNPFVVGVHGRREDVVRWHSDLVERGMVTMTNREHVEEQRAHLAYVKANIGKLIGKDLCCFCPIDAPCHADNYLRLAARISCEEAQ